jgi:site-specific recombinase XerD
MSQSTTLALVPSTPDDFSPSLSEPTPSPSFSLPLRRLAESFRRSLKMDVQRGRKTDDTVRAYMGAVLQFADYLDEKGMPSGIEAISREHIEAYVEHLCDTRKPSTAYTRFRNLKGFFKWCVNEDHLSDHPMKNMTQPYVPEPTSEDVFSESQLKALLGAVKPRGKRDADYFANVRDTAMLSLFIWTGCRRDELASLTLPAEGERPNPQMTPFLDLDSNVVHVLGKGSGRGKRAREIPFGPEAAKALDAYLLARESHLAKHGATSSALWISTRSPKPMSYSGIGDVIKRAGRLAGLGEIHCHQFRHTRADRLLRDGMRELDVMRLMGWKSAMMLQRYGRATATERAINAYRELYG